MKISTRLMVQSALLIAMLLMMSLFAWQSNKQAKSSQQEMAHIFTEMEHSVDTARYAQVMFKTQIQEWKNVLLRGHDPDQYKKYKGAFETKGGIVQEELAKLKETLASIDIKTPLITEASSSLKALNSKYLSALAQYEGKEVEELQSIDGLVKALL